MSWHFCLDMANLGAAQERLISLVAGHLLDSNSEERLGPGVTEEYRSNLAQNLADAIDLLPKLVRLQSVCSSYHLVLRSTTYIYKLYHLHQARKH